jgi:hypothetical protein
MMESVKVSQASLYLLLIKVNTVINVILENRFNDPLYLNPFLLYLSHFALFSGYKPSIS